MTRARTVLRRVLVAVVPAVGLGVLAPVAPAPAASAGAAQGETPERTVVVGIPGLAWSDVDSGAMPVTRGLVEDADVASLTVRAVRSRACAVDGWLTLSAGRRAADAAGACRVPEPVGADGRVPHWADYVAAAGRDGYGAAPGLLGSAVDGTGSCVAAVGPGAAVAAADRDGVVAQYDATMPATLSCPLTIVDGGTLPAEPAADRAAALARADAVVASAVEAAGDGAVVVAGIGDGDSPVRPRALLVTDRSGDVGDLTSPSTRQPGLVQLQDVTATLLTQYGGGNVAAVNGRATTVVVDPQAAADRVADRVGFEVRSTTLRSVSPQVTGWLAAGFAAWCVAVAVVLRRRRGAALPPPLRVAGVALALVPVGTFLANLVPWWHAGAPATVFAAALAVAVAVTTALAVLAQRRHPHGALLVAAVVTLVVLVVDVSLGSDLQLASVFGQNPTVGGRFYGIGNTSYALYGVATLTVVALVARSATRRSLVAATVLLLVLAAVEGWPSLGADFGGPPGLVLGGLVVLAGASRVRVTPVRVLVAGAAVVVLTAGVAVLDWLRPAAARTHLGEFVQTVLDGGVDDVLGRKLAQNLTNLTSPPLLAIALAAVLVAVVAHHSGFRPNRTEVLVLRGSAVLALVGFAVNDSGLVIPAFAALGLLPLVAARARDREAVPAQ